MTHQTIDRDVAQGLPAGPRIAAIGAVDPAAPDHVHRLTRIAVDGLHRAYLPEVGGFVQTLRGVAGGQGVRLQSEGDSIRYAAMAALGLGCVPVEEQRRVLAGSTAADLAVLTAERAEREDDPGAQAIAAWAAAEVAGELAGPLLSRLALVLDAGRPLATVAAAWTLAAAVAAHPHGATDRLVARATRLLLDQTGPHHLYPHVLPKGAGSRWRSHVGSFADQVYPLQALARASSLTGIGYLRQAADTTAALLCGLQGPAGQWWWHYDVRDGSVVEPYPVYSVHQHAMAPMVLFDLQESGGADHRPAIARGLSWLRTHPEVVEELESERFGLVWRKVGRREPVKAARALQAAASAVRPGARVPGTGLVLPPRLVDHECRPYELGWLLYAWLSGSRPARVRS